MNDELYQSTTDDPLFDPITAAIQEIYDPEIPVNIYDLGLIYGITIADNNVDIKMTLTSPACPVAGEMPEWVGQAVAGVDGVNKVNVDLVWDPPWGIENLTDEAKLELGLI
jgi:FeS assembly SUF system protein